MCTVSFPGGASKVFLNIVLIKIKRINISKQECVVFSSHNILNNINYNM